MEGVISWAISTGNLGIYNLDDRFYRYASEFIGVPSDGIAHVANPWYGIFGVMNSKM